MNKARQHIRDIGSKALTIALVCVFVFQPFSPLVTFADSGSSPVGFLDSASCTSFEGWAYDADDSNTSIGIHFYTDINSVHTFLDSTTANGARADVNASQNISGDHGFSFPVPSSLKDGQSHLIYAYGIDLSGGSNTLLSNSPLQISGCTNGNPVNTAPSSPSVTIPSPLVEGTTVTFSAVATDPQGDQVAYGFDWNGDTTLDQTELTSYVPSGTSASLSHIFYTPGTYTVGVYARDAQLTSAVNTIQFTVTTAGGSINTAPLAPDVTIPSPLVEGTTVTFSAVSTDPQGDQVAYGFDWNGDTTLDQTELTSYVPSGTSASLSHIFYTPGTYTVGVYARDISLTSLVKSIQFTVTAASTGGSTGGGNPVNTAPSSPSVTIPSPLVEGTTVTFSAVATDPQGDQVAYGFDWNGDTTLDQTELTSYVPSGTSASLSHIFYTPGTYTVGVYARDAQLTSAVKTIQFTVSATPSTGGGSNGNTVDYLGSFSISPTTIQSGQTAVISWASTNNATLCLASGDWSGYQALSNNGFNIGVQNFAVTTTKTYTLECGNGTASTTRTVTLTINPVNPGGNNNGGNPGGSVATFFATPNPVVSGSTAVLTWTSTNANLCVAAGAWLGNQLPSGTYTIPATTVTAPKTDTYSIACGNAFGTTTGVVNLVTNPASVNPSKDFTISPLSGLSTSESGGQATFAVVLVSAPLADVVLPVMSSNFAEGTTSVTSLVFTSANWAVPQNVVVTGQDDTASDGSVAYSVNVGASASTDTTWNNIPAKAVSLTNTDNEPVVVPPTGGGGGGPSSSSGGHSGGGHGPCTGFGCVTVATTTIPVITVPTTSTAVSGPELVCPTTNFITTFMRIGIDNHPNEVRKLQYFLNTYEGAHLAIDGDFNPATEAAVMALQAAHSNEILAPWGVTVPTGIVYITTTRYINRVFCGDNPTYTGNESLKDILDTTHIDIPVDNSAQFEGVVGQATTSNSFIANIGGVFGAMTQRVLDLIKDIPWYQLLILLLILTGCWFIMGIAFKKDMAKEEFHMSLIRGSAALAVGSVLNVLNTLSFILNPQWFTDKAGFGLGWLLALDIINLLALILICITTLITLYQKVIRNGINR